MAGGVEGSGGTDPFDAFDAFVLDEEFVRSATIVELSADERFELDDRRRRHEELQRRLETQRTDHLLELDRSRWIRRRRRRVRIAALVVLGGLAGTALWFVVAGRSATPSSTTANGGAARTSGASHPPDLSRFGSADADDRPSRSSEEAAQPLGRVPAVGGTGGYEFLATQDDDPRPVAYDPCRPIHYVVNARTAFAGADSLLAAAIADVSRATGLRFVADDATDEAPSDSRAFFQPDRYGDRWAPVLIAWSDAAETPDLAGSVAGLGGSAWVEGQVGSADLGSAATGKVYVSGTVTLDGPDLRRLEAAGSGARAEVKAVIEHELGHLVGLDHVNDRHELMYPRTVVGVDGYRTGDRRGLARLGAGDCFPDV